tara:strand:+ start:267 stop:635 length:369 start_codon:yes stop_codon:yes gene_type:complete
VTKHTNKKKIIKSIDPDLHFRALHVLEDNPELSQRELAKTVGVSLGRINYCLKALVEKGQLKINNFTNNKNKSVYLYLLTPRGVKEKTKLTSGFLKRKLNEYELLRKEIDSLQLTIKRHIER